jgi:AbrB family looped-hinge helix DNA binding protein
VEAIVGVDERGQMVLPKDLRMRAGIEPGQRLAVTSWTRGGKVCCLTLTPVDDLSGLIKDHLGPVMKDLLQP